MNFDTIGYAFLLIF